MPFPPRSWNNHIFKHANPGDEAGFPPVSDGPALRIGGRAQLS